MGDTFTKVTTFEQLTCQFDSINGQWDNEIVIYETSQTFNEISLSIFTYSDNTFCGHESYLLSGPSADDNSVMLSDDQSKILYNASADNTL